MARLVLAVGVIFLLAAGANASAQHRTAQSPPSRPAATAPPSPNTPAAGSRFTSRLTFDGRAVEPARPHVPVLGGGRSVFLPGYPFLWGWDTRSTTQDIGLVPLDPANLPRGGVQLDVLPWRASVFLDGVYVGRVEDFRGYYHHLDAPSGPHQIAIVEQGYEPLILDLIVPAGRTMTHRGTLSEALTR